MSLEANRRRFLALASLALSAVAGTGAHGQGSGGQDSTDPVRRPSAPPRPRELPEGIPSDPNADVIEDIGPWHIVSTLNVARAWIPPERLTVAQGGVEGSVPGSDTMQLAVPSANILDENGKIVGTTTSSSDGNKVVDSGRRILIGGRANIEIQYWAAKGSYEGVLRVQTTSNNQPTLPIRVLLDGREVKSLPVKIVADIDAAELFGADLSKLAAARSLVITAEIDGAWHTIFEVDLTNTAAALQRMRHVPDYNYNIRRIGRKSVSEEMRDARDPPPSTNCFLTTACCDIVGLADDCFELTALRRFRDRVMLVDEGGRRDVEHYYLIAPPILAAMDERGERWRLRGLYFATILPCALLASLGLNRITQHLYTRMMRRLEARYA